VIILIGLRRIDVSDLAELRQLSIVYKDDLPTEQGRVLTSPVALIVVNREGQYWRLDEDGTEDGEMLPGIYDISNAT